MRVSEYYSLNRTQASLDFLDVDIYNDIKLYIDPYSFNIISSEFSDKCIFKIQDYFNTLLTYIRSNETVKARIMLQQLREPNETHLGMSKEVSKGRGLGPYLATKILHTLSMSEAVKTGLIQNIEESALMIEGISYDIISDIVTNIIREELIEYTQEMCELYSIPLESNIASGPIWDTTTKQWINRLVSLPKTDSGALLLIPKAIIRKKANYDVNEYYSHYVLDYLRTEEFSANSNLIEILKNGRQRITNKTLEAKYGSARKQVSITQTLRKPEILNNYRISKEQNISSPLEHEELCIEENSPSINYTQILSELKAIPTGTADADRYEKKIEELLTSIFSPDLMYPKAQHRIHEGRKRIDITYANIAQDGFFYWLMVNYPASHIFIECKNYSVDLSNPEFDQLSGRFSPSRGKFGFLVCRKNDNKDAVLKRCQDTARDDRGFIILLEDEDFEELINLRRSINYRDDLFTYLKNKFDALIM